MINKLLLTHFIFLKNYLISTQTLKIRNKLKKNVNYSMLFYFLHINNILYKYDWKNYLVLKTTFKYLNSLNYNFFKKNQIYFKLPNINYKIKLTELTSEKHYILNIILKNNFIFIKKPTININNFKSINFTYKYDNNLKLNKFFKYLNRIDICSKFINNYKKINYKKLPIFIFKKYEFVLPFQQNIFCWSYLKFNSSVKLVFKFNQKILFKNCYFKKFNNKKLEFNLNFFVNFFINCVETKNNLFNGTFINNMFASNKFIINKYNLLFFKNYSWENKKFISETIKKNLKLNNYYPVLFANKKVYSIFFNKFKYSYNMNYTIFNNKLIINFLEKFLKKKISVTISNNYFNKFNSYHLSSLIKNYKNIQPSYFNNYSVSDFIEILWYSFFLKDLSIMSDWISKFMEGLNFKNHKKFVSFFQNFINKNSGLFMDVLKIRGFFFDIRGKVGVTGSSKKRHFFVKFGSLNKSSKNYKLDFNQNLVRSYSGVMGVTYIICY